MATETTRPKIEIELNTDSLVGGCTYTVRLGERYHDMLNFDEMLGCIIRLTINGNPRPETAGYGGLKTAAEHEAQRKFWEERQEQAEVKLKAKVNNGNG